MTARGTRELSVHVTGPQRLPGRKSMVTTAGGPARGWVISVRPQWVHSAPQKSAAVNSASAKAEVSSNPWKLHLLQFGRAAGCPGVSRSDTVEKGQLGPCFSLLMSLNECQGLHFAEERCPGSRPREKVMTVIGHFPCHGSGEWPRTGPVECRGCWSVPGARSATSESRQR